MKLLVGVALALLAGCSVPVPRPPAACGPEPMALPIAFTVGLQPPPRRGAPAP